MNFATLTSVLLSISFEDLTTEIQLSNHQSCGIYSDICLISSTGIQLAVCIAEIFIVEWIGLGFGKNRLQVIWWMHSTKHKISVGKKKKKILEVCLAVIYDTDYSEENLSQYG